MRTVLESIVVVVLCSVNRGVKWIELVEVGGCLGCLLEVVAVDASLASARRERVLYLSFSIHTLLNFSAGRP